MVKLKLSGGITINLNTSKKGSRWPTFTIGFGNSFKDDELQQAKESLRRSLYSLNKTDRLLMYQNVFSLMEKQEIEKLFYPDLLEPHFNECIFSCWSDYIQYVEDADDLGGLQLLEIRSTLPDELMMYADKLSMAHSLEMRVPYLDYTIVEYVERLNASYKVRGFKQKYLHRQVCKQYLPKTIMNRKKTGFALDIVDDWLKSSVKSKMINYLKDNSSLMYSYLNPASVQQLLYEHQQGIHNHYKILFSLVIFEEWLHTIS